MLAATWPAVAATPAARATAAAAALAVRAAPTAARAGASAAPRARRAAALRCRPAATPAAARARPAALRCHATTMGSSGRIPNAQLLGAALAAAKAGADVVLVAADKPRRVMSKGDALDVVTETDAAAERAIAQSILSTFPDHPILGEEGGIIGGGDVSKSEWLWVVDPLDGTVNFSHAIPGFSVSVAVLRHATPVAGVVVEFTGGPGNWATRTYAASRNGGATVDGRPLQCSRVSKLSEAVVACEMVWYGSTRAEDDAENDWARAVWPETQRLIGGLVREVRGLRCSGSAAVNLARVAQGQCDGYVQYWLKPWDVAAGVLLVEEAGGRVSTADGAAYSVFDRSMLATNDALFEKMLERTEPRTAAIQAAGVKLGPADVPKGYGVRGGRQME